VLTEIVLRHAENTAEITACFPVMVLLRPHLANAEEFAARVARQYAAGYRLFAAWRDGMPIGLAGYRVEENLIHGRFVYLDDLVISEGERRHGIGALLLESVAVEGRRLGCGRLVLDTALDSVLAHRFYYRCLLAQLLARAAAAKRRF
jgi:GNAT superfamily N-acetyltransferase